jgi:hypothetical protein
LAIGPPPRSGLLFELSAWSTMAVSAIFWTTVNAFDTPSDERVLQAPNWSQPGPTKCVLAGHFKPLSCRLLKGSERKIAPMTVSSSNVIEIKLDRLIDDMRLLRSQMTAFDMRQKGIEASLKASEPSEQQPESKSRPWFAAAAIATARTVLILFAVGAATGSALLYLGT